MQGCFTDKHEEIKNKILNSETYITGVENASRIFSMLGEPNRMKIILALMEGELCVYHICEIVGGKQSAVSQHLRKLKDNHIVKSRKDGTQVLYSIADEHIYSIVKSALEHTHCF
ncbi:MAG: winged helix-turn-helix transcriptional regulator [Clostridia bacterium]|nr:winged helix-turn-helix transcriptional regulator [Clostridia bacterium]